MTCRDLVELVEQIQPEASPRDVARFCLLLANFVENLDDLADDAHFAEAWHEMGIRLQAMTDQHAAMTAELEELSRVNLDHFSIDHVWVLIRAIRVQSQFLQLYIGQPQPV
jgi:hypothetical protein